jgi:hypothetical protein
MSSKVKKCKVCGTSEAANFAPRKSVMCKNCDKGNVITLPVIDITPVSLPEVVETSINEVEEIIVNDEKGLKSIIENLQETVKQLQEDIVKLNKIKKLFPRIFPEDNM